LLDTKFQGAFEGAARFCHIILNHDYRWSRDVCRWYRNKTIHPAGPQINAKIPSFWLGIFCFRCSVESFAFKSEGGNKKPMRSSGFLHFDSWLAGINGVTPT